MLFSKKKKESSNEFKEYESSNAIGNKCPLSQLKVNQKGKVLSFVSDNKALRRRLLDMGVTKNCIIKVKQFSPLGDPVNVSLRGYDLCIRKNDMNNIMVEVIE